MRQIPSTAPRAKGEIRPSEAVSVTHTELLRQGSNTGFNLSPGQNALPTHSTICLVKVGFFVCFIILLYKKHKSEDQTYAIFASIFKLSLKYFYSTISFLLPGKTNHTQNSLSSINQIGCFSKSHSDWDFFLICIILMYFYIRSDTNI